jgi:Tol biopolymer transport system component
MTEFSWGEQQMPEKNAFSIFCSALLTLMMVIAVYGRPIKQLTTAVGDDDEPCFSPDGKKIAYSCGLSTGYHLGDMAIFTMAAEKEPTQSTKGR